jgi:hypothetical protein
MLLAVSRESASLASIRPDPSHDLKALTERADRAVKVADLPAIVARCARSSEHRQAAFRVGTALACTRPAASSSSRRIRHARGAGRASAAVVLGAESSAYSKLEVHAEHLHDQECDP